MSLKRILQNILVTLIASSVNVKQQRAHGFSSTPSFTIIMTNTRNWDKAVVVTTHSKTVRCYVHNERKNNNDIMDTQQSPFDKEEGHRIIQKLNLSSQFNRWKVLQNILEEEESPSGQDINEILYVIFKSFYDYPRPKVLPSGDRNPSPTLNEDQRNLLMNTLFRYEEDDKTSGWIDAIPIDETGNDSMDYDRDDIVEVNALLEKFQPDREEDEDAFKSCWDLVMELYGREATRMAEQSGDRSWKVRSGIVRLLIHYDFLNDGLDFIS